VSVPDPVSARFPPADDAAWYAPGTCRPWSAHGSRPRCAAATPGRPPTCRGPSH